MAAIILAEGSNGDVERAGEQLTEKDALERATCGMQAGKCAVSIEQLNIIGGRVRGATCEELLRSLLFADFFNWTKF
ncbi:hypothetical protein J41TS12_27900 [Paenibacillus antibioticophila]|uniref:Uncharacterized protein n=1 Tax=Paenibacillus antibioticophila TaxID=1274374 RepID=A0A920CI54_9BACL|nr:hypothetical protein J41TS12_27900 [Paenibacillus antibioticophila]